MPPRRYTKALKFRTSGLTLIEIMIVAVIILTIFAFMLPRFFNSFVYGADKTLDGAREVAHLIQTAQSNAANNKDNTYWGIHLVDDGTTECNATAAVDCAVLYKGKFYADRDSTQSTIVPLNSRNQFGTIETSDINFTKFSGFARTFPLGVSYGPKYYYTSNASSTFDFGGNFYNGTLYGDKLYSTSTCAMSSGCFNFNGTSGYVNIANTSLPSGASSRSMCAWAKADVTDTYRWVVAYGAVSGGATAMFIGQGNPGTDLQVGGWTDDITVANFWDTTNWHHVCLTYNGAQARVYGDGALIAGPTSKDWSVTLDKAYIGRQINDAEYWDGKIDEVMIFDRAISANEVTSLYQFTKPSSTWDGMFSNIHITNGNATTTIQVYNTGAVTISPTR